MRVWCSGFNRKGKGETLKKEARGSRVFHERVGFTVGSRVNWDRDLKTSQRVSGFQGKMDDEIQSSEAFAVRLATSRVRSTLRLRCRAAFEHYQATWELC